MPSASCVSVCDGPSMAVCVCADSRGEGLRAVQAGVGRDVRDFVARVGIGAAACHCGDVVWCGFAWEVPIAGGEGGRWGEKMGGLELLRLPRDWGARADGEWPGWGE